MALITVVGSGMMGTAIMYPAAVNGNRVRLVGTPLDREIIEHARATNEHKTLKRRLPDGFEFYQIEELESALEGAELLLCGVSSFGVDWFCENIIPVIPETLPVLAITKGMMNDGGGEMISYPEHMRRVAERLGRRLDISAVGGPCTSYELADSDPTEVTFCGWDMERLRWLRSLFETDIYHVSLSTDVRGVECAVALKNAYALAVSLAIGLSYAREGGREIEHYNSQAALFGQSLREMSLLLKAVVGGEDNLFLGAGDLYVTVFGGRTRRIGTLLGMGLSFDEAMSRLRGVTLESIVITGRTTKAVREGIALGKLSEADFPLLLHIDSLINDGAKVNIPWEKFERL